MCLSSAHSGLQIHAFTATVSDKMVMRPVFVILFVFLRLRICPPRIKLAASNFERWFIGFLGRESHILGNFAVPVAQNRTNRPVCPCCNVMLLGFCDSHANQVRTAWGRRIGMCGYTVVPEDGRTCFVYFYPALHISWLWTHKASEFTNQSMYRLRYTCDVPGGIRRNVPLQHFTEDDEYLRIVSR